MAGIANDVKQIRQALYGREVREAIAHGIEQCYSDVTASKTVADTAAAAANTATQNAQTATQQANQARDNAQAVADGVVNQSITAINDAAAQQRQSVNDLGDQLKSYLEDHYGETTDKVAAKANRSSVSTVKHAIGADGKLTLTDALNEPAKKMTIHLEPKQDLHGYDHPWVGGAGKNLVTLSGMDLDKTVSGITLSTNGSELTIKGTATAEVQNNAALASQYARMPMGPFPAGTYTIKATGFEWQNASDRLLINARYSDNSDVENAYSKRIGGNASGTVTFTATQTFKFGLFMALQPGSTFDCTVQVQFEVGSTATDYEPYENICPIEGFDSVETVGTDVNIYDKSQVIYGKNWLNGNSANRAVFVAKTEKGKTLHLRATQHGNTHRIVIVGVNKFGPNTVQSFNKHFQPGLSTISYEVTADEYVICQFERYNDAANADVTPEDIDVWNIAISYSDINSVSLNLVSSAGSTVYGGTVTVNEDGSGTLVVDKKMIDLGSLNWTYYNDYTRFVALDVLDIPAQGTNRMSTFFSSDYEVISDGRRINAVPQNCIYMGYMQGMSDRVLFVHDSRYTDATAFKAAVTGSTIIVPLTASRITTYQFTSAQLQTLVGTNHVWTDGTSIDLDYYADRYSDIDKLYAALPKDTATGNPATFPDGADDLPIEKLEVAIEPKQDLHGYDRPWVGGAGKNLLDLTSVTVTKTDGGITATPNGDGTFNLSGTASSNTINIWLAGAYGSSAPTIFTLPAGTYTVYDCVLFKGTAGAGGGSTYAAIHAPQKITSTSPIEVSGIRISNVTSGQNYNGSMLRPAIYSGEYTSGNLPSWEPYENICPIIGLDELTVTNFGVNILDISDSSKDFITILPAGTYTLKRFNSSSDTQINSRIELLINNSYQYIISGEYDDGNVKVISGDLGWGTAPSQIIITKKEYTLRFLGSTKNALSVHNATLMMVPGTTVPTSYEPYNGSTILPISLRSISGSTVYGGKLTVNRDGTGKLVVDRAKVNFAGVQWAVNGTYANTYNVTLTSPNCPRHAVTDAELMKSISNKYMWFNSGIVGNQDYGFAMSINNDLQFYVKDKTIATASDANAKFADLEICFPLHYPTTYPLTAPQITTLLGTNHISCDAGQVTVMYCQDPKLVIGNRTDKIMSALTPYVEETMVATRNYIAGEILSVGTNLYKTTTAIANGASLTVGTNVENTTLTTGAANGITINATPASAMSVEGGWVNVTLDKANAEIIQAASSGKSIVKLQNYGMTIICRQAEYTSYAVYFHGVSIDNSLLIYNVMVTSSSAQAALVGSVAMTR